MRIRIIRPPRSGYIDGIRLDDFIVGQQYELGIQLSALFLSEGWAEPVDDADVNVVVPLEDFEPDMSSLPSNLTRETFPPYYENPPSAVLDRRRRRRKRH